MRVGAARAIQGGLALVGITFFVLLLTDADFGGIPAASLQMLPQFILVVLGLVILNYTFDTASWWLVCGHKRPPIWRLMLIRLRTEAITNVVPGGAVIGEPMKIGLLGEASGMSRTEATTSFLLSKFVLILGQTIYILLGLALSWSVINAVSEEAFNVENFGLIVLAGALLILGIILSIAAAMIWFQPMNSRLRFTTRTGRIANTWNLILRELRDIEHLVAREFRRYPWRFVLAIIFSFISWSLNGVELWAIAQWLDIPITFQQAYAIDAVSVVVRMVIFVIPIGMGGQDWTIAGLTAAHAIPDPTASAARMVLMKRSREFFVIGIGLVLLLVMPGRGRGVKGRSIAEGPQQEGCAGADSAGSNTDV